MTPSLKERADSKSEFRILSFHFFNHSSHWISSDLQSDFLFILTECIISSKIILHPMWVRVQYLRKGEYSRISNMISKTIRFDKWLQRCTVNVALQQLNCNNYTAKIAMQQLHCNKCTAIIALQQCTANVALQQLHCNSYTAPIALQPAYLRRANTVFWYFSSSTLHPCQSMTWWHGRVLI